MQCCPTRAAQHACLGCRSVAATTWSTLTCEREVPYPRRWRPPCLTSTAGHCRMLWRRVEHDALSMLRSRHTCRGWVEVRPASNLQFPEACVRCAPPSLRSNGGGQQADPGHARPRPGALCRRAITSCSAPGARLGGCRSPIGCGRLTPQSRLTPPRCAQHGTARVGSFAVRLAGAPSARPRTPGWLASARSPPCRGMVLTARARARAMPPHALVALCCALLIGGVLAKAEHADVADRGEAAGGRSVPAAGV